MNTVKLVKLLMLFCMAGYLLPLNAQKTTSRVALTTNFLSWATLAPNLGTEIYIGKKLSIAADGSYGMWNYGHTHGNIQTWSAGGEAVTGCHLLLGISPYTQQLLTLTLHYAEGEPQTETYDLTRLLAGFNNFEAGSGTDAFVLSGNLSLDQSIEEAGITGSINDWTTGTETDMDADNE